MITFQVEEYNGTLKTINVPEQINLSLMEVLRASDYPVLATCGGMGLCATCHVEVKAGIDKLNAATEAELYTLDSLPNSRGNSRLACQIRISENMNGAIFALMDECLA